LEELLQCKENEAHELSKNLSEMREINEELLESNKQQSNEI
jgi:hypothetical protein